MADRAKLPQLRMGFRRFADLEPPAPPAPYGLRRFRPGDEDAWVAILAAGQFEVAWDRARLDRMLAGTERTLAPTDGAFFVTLDDRPVGTACTHLHLGHADGEAELGWVAVHPDHRGHRLARAVSLAVLSYVRDLGHGYAYLMTEDFRLPALATYLRLGFAPDMTDPGHPARWDAIRKALAGRGERRIDEQRG
jgi:GNAT superfamily N-acetyltransferase